MLAGGLTGIRSLAGLGDGVSEVPLCPLEPTENRRPVRRRSEKPTHTIPLHTADTSEKNYAGALDSSRVPYNEPSKKKKKSPKKAFWSFTACALRQCGISNVVRARVIAVFPPRTCAQVLYLMYVHANEDFYPRSSNIITPTSQTRRTTA